MTEWTEVTTKLAQQLVGGANPSILRRGQNKFSKEQSVLTNSDVTAATSYFLSTATDKPALISKLKELKSKGTPQLNEMLYLLHRIKSSPAVLAAATRPTPPPLAQAAPAGPSEVPTAPALRRATTDEPGATGKHDVPTPQGPSTTEAEPVRRATTDVTQHRQPAQPKAAAGAMPPDPPLATPPPRPRPGSTGQQAAAPHPAQSNPLYDAAMVPSPPQPSAARYAPSLTRSLAAASAHLGAVTPGLGPAGDLYAPRGAAPKQALAGAPPTPDWNLTRPYLTGDFVLAAAHGGRGNDLPIVPMDGYSPSAQEIAVIDDLLYAFMGMDGQYIKARTYDAGSNAPQVAFTCAAKIEPSLQELVSRMLQIPECVVATQRFIEVRSDLSRGTVSHALAAGMRSVLGDWQLVVAQLEHQLRMGQLSLQSLWFYCQQPLSNLRVMASVAVEASARNLTSAGLLNLLAHKSAALAGDLHNGHLLQKLLQAAAVPYFRVLDKWLCEGVIEDPHGEFMVEADERIGPHTEEPGADASPYWRRRYRLRQAPVGRVAPAQPRGEAAGEMPAAVDDVPTFLEGSKVSVLTTGKYLNTVRECGRPVARPLRAGTHVAYDAGGGYVRLIAQAYRSASGQLLAYMMNDEDAGGYGLMGWLLSLKHTFLLDQSDFMVFFLDIAASELAKKGTQISHTRMQSLLEMALKSTLAASDPHHESVTFKVDVRDALALRKAAMPTRAPTAAAAAADESRLEKVSGWGLFSMQFNVEWPLSLVVSNRQREQYQLVFKSLFILQYAERMLREAWSWLASPQKWHAKERAYPDDLDHPNLTLALSTTSVMLHFVRQFFQYLTFEVVEPAWHVMEEGMEEADSVDDVIAHHRRFLLKLIKGCLLDDRHILYHITQIDSTVVSFCQLIRQTFRPLDASAVTARASEARHAADTPRTAAVAAEQLTKTRQQVMDTLHDLAAVDFDEEIEGMFQGLLQDAAARGHCASSTVTFGNLCIAFRRRFEVRLGHLIHGMETGSEAGAQRLRGLADVYADALKRAQSSERLAGSAVKDGTAVDPRDLIDNLHNLIERLKALQRLTVRGVVGKR